MHILTDSSPVKRKLTTAGGQRNKMKISGGRFDGFLLLVFASLVDVEGEIFFLSKTYYKNQGMPGYQH